MPLLPSLEVSVEWSVLKLALDRLRSCLKLKSEGAIAVRAAESCQGQSSCVPLRSWN